MKYNTLLMSFLFLALINAGTPTFVFSQGIVFPWVGPVNRSMGGAGTAAPLDAITATYWNPAAMSDMDRSDLSASLELYFPSISTDSSVTGLGSGSSTSESGLLALPSIAMVYKTGSPIVDLGFSLVPIGGAKTNYASSASNPFFAPQANAAVPGGFGQVFTEAQFLQIAPSVSIALTDFFSIGFAPTVTVGQVVVEPFLFGAPDDADGSGVPRYASGRGNQFQYGLGAQVSFFYRASPVILFGGSIKSPQWMDEARSNGTNELGLPRNDLTSNFDIPMTVSLGTAMYLTDSTLFALDARYIDHKNADGWGPSGFNADGSLAGLGFSNSYGILAGIQQSVSETVDLRVGYSFLSNPLSSSEATIAVAAPLIYQHAYSAGCSIGLTENMKINFAYTFMPESELSGPIVTPLGAVPNSTVATRINAHVASLGFQTSF